MDSIFLIESPLQLLFAKEAIVHYGIKEYIIYLRISGEKNNDDQMCSLLPILSIPSSRIKKIPIKSKFRTFNDYIRLIYYYFNINLYSKKVNRIFIGNFSSNVLKVVMKYIQKSKIILLDDGSGSLYIQDKFDDEYNYNLFTIFELKSYKNQTISKNNFMYCQNILLQKSKKKDVVLFLGSKLVEVGIMSEEKYFKYLDSIMNKFNNEYIIYVPHRGEDVDKLERIERRFKNLGIKYYGYPIELIGVVDEFIPCKVISFYSTALYTMNKLYGCESIAFKFDYSKSIYSKSIDIVYKYYAKHMKVLELV